MTVSSRFPSPAFPKPKDYWEVEIDYRLVGTFGIDYCNKKKKAKKIKLWED